MNRKVSKISGVTLFETIVYIAIFAVLFILVINVLITMSGSFTEVERFRQVTTGGALPLERMSREIRDANSINVAESAFETSPGALTVNTKDAQGNSHTVHFFVTNQTLFIETDSDGGTPLVGDGVVVTNLIFRDISGDKSQAVKIELEVQNKNGSRKISIPFYNTIVLRGSYE